MVEPIKTLRKICFPNGEDGDDIYRKISIYVTWVLLHTGIHPDVITFTRVIVCTLGFIFFMKGNMFYAVIGVLLYQLNIFLDTMDGAIARYQKKTSKRGEYQDAILDHIMSSIIYFLSAGILSYQLNNEWRYLVLAFMIIIMAQIAAYLRAVFIEFGLSPKKEKKNILIKATHTDNLRTLTWVFLIFLIFNMERGVLLFFSIFVFAKVVILSTFLYIKCKKNPFSTKILVPYILTIFSIIEWLIGKIIRKKVNYFAGMINKRYHTSKIANKVIKELL